MAVGKSKYFVVVIGFGLLLLVGCLLSYRVQAGQTNQKNRPKPLSQQPGEEVDPDDVIRTYTTMVSSPVLVLGRNGRFVPSLRRADFLVYEDGVQQTIAHFANVDAPFTVAILIDNSRSTYSDLENVQDAAIAFVNQMRVNDRALVISFSGKIRVLAEPTADHQVLKRAIRGCRPEGSSRVYDAIAFVLKEQLAKIEGRTALILFSDGIDNASVEASFESTIELIKKTRASIFPVQFTSYAESSPQQSAPVGSGFSRGDYLKADAYLHQAAAVSGTGVYPARDISDLERAVSSIADELHNEYSIGYYPLKPISVDVERTIEVRTKFPYLVVKARTSYSSDASGAVKRLSRNIEGAALETNGGGSIPVTRPTVETKLEQNARWVCKNTSSPLDLAVVREGFVSYCPKSNRPSDENNAWFVKPPGKIETVCKGFMLWQGKEIAGAPIPIGYVVTGEASSQQCTRSAGQDSQKNAWIIQRPETTDTVCKGFLLPRGYVMVRETVVPDCPTKGNLKNAWIIRRK